jgi:hypothetical protein
MEQLSDLLMQACLAIWERERPTVRLREWFETHFDDHREVRRRKMIWRLVNAGFDEGDIEAISEMDEYQRKTATKHLELTPRELSTLMGRDSSEFTPPEEWIPPTPDPDLFNNTKSIPIREGEERHDDAA